MNPPCPYCGAPTAIRCDSVIYGRRFGNVLICSRYPDCDSYVGCHQRNGKPKGTLADAATREARKAAHAVFDPLWKDGGWRRSEAYAWLARQLGLPTERCHIGEFDVATCRRVAEACGNRV